jgi:hypothetical protein
LGEYVGITSDNTESRKQEVTDDLREFHTDIIDEYSGDIDMNASYFFCFDPYYRTGTCSGSVCLWVEKGCVPVAGVDSC